MAEREIRFWEIYAGIGGFREGLTRASSRYRPVGYCEIDPYARKAYELLYEPKGERYDRDARAITPEELPDFDLLCGGFPCQSFSIAGARRAFADPRGTLFFEIARIAAVKRPSVLFLENVFGILSADGGRVFATILAALDELGYDVAWQVLNSSDYSIPQNRKRVFLIGFLRDRCPGQVLAFRDANPRNLQHGGDEKGIADLIEPEIVLPIKSATKAGFRLARHGDGINIAYLRNNARRGRVGDQISQTLTTNPTQGVFLAEPVQAVLNPDRTTVRQQGRRIKEVGEPMFTLTAQDRHGIRIGGRIRRLTPLEYWRLQGFTDEQFAKLAPGNFGDRRLYQMAGNAVTVTVIQAIAEWLLQIFDEMEAT